MSKLTDIYCPACDRQGIDSLMMSEPLGHRCVVQNHRYEYTKLMSLKPRMKPYPFVEKQPGGTVAQTIWVYPEAWRALHERYPQNLMTTVCSLLAALADGDSMIVEGEYVREMAAMGVTKGREIAGLAAANAQLKKDLDEARLREKVLEPILKLLGGAAAAQQLAPVSAAAGESTEDLPSRSPVAELLPDPDGDYNPLGMMSDAGAPTRPPGPPAVRGIPRPGAPTKVR